MLLACITTFGQQSDKFTLKNSVEFELFGQGGFYSLNYERTIFNREKFKTLAEAGIAGYPQSTGVIPLFVPVSINQLFSFHSNHLELGVGHVLINDRLPDGSNDYKFFGSFKIGYRYQKPDGKFLFKAALTPFVDYWDTVGNTIYVNASVNVVPWGGLTLGYNF